MFGWVGFGMYIFVFGFCIGVGWGFGDFYLIWVICDEVHNRS